jgi:hypothetical protein
MTPETINAAGRSVPQEINGNTVIPFKGVGRHRPVGRKYCLPIPTCSDYPEDGNKLTVSLEEALRKCGLRDGMTISTHHHLRDGDLISNKVFEIASAMGVKDLIWFPSASFPCNDVIMKYLEDGTVHHIEGSMNGPLGRFVSEGRMKGTAVLRSHGGRVQAIQDGEVKIDIAVLAAPSADCFGNAKGTGGNSSCGVLGYAWLRYLLEAMPAVWAESPGTRLVVAGSGSLAPYGDLLDDPRVEVVNRFIDDAEVPGLFSRARVVALPYVEGTQTGVIPIAYAFKRPVVVTDVGAIPEVVEEGRTGFVVPPRDPGRLAGAILMILQNEPLRTTMGAAAYEKMTRELSWGPIADRTVAAYREVVERAR